MVAELFRNRSGLVLIVIVSGLATSLLKGNSPLVGAAGIFGVLCIAGLLNRRYTGNTDPEIPNESRQLGEPFCWRFNAAGGCTASTAIEVLKGLGFHLIADDGHIVHLESGGQIRMRLLGGYFIKPRFLPTTVLVERPKGQGDGLSVVVRDRIGRIGWRDQAFRARYAMRADEIREALGAAATES